jgi:hypothetical protein
MISSLRRGPQVAALALSLGASAAVAQTGPIPLIVEDVESDVAGEVNLIVRTGVALSLDSGTFELEARDHDGTAAAIAAVVSVTAFSTVGDAVAQASLDFDTQRIVVGFSSPSATINEEPGPLVVVRILLASGLLENQRFDLRVVPGSTTLTSSAGGSVPAVADRGRLRLRPTEPGEAALGPEGSEIPPGATAVFGLSADRPYAIGSGTVELLYDATIADGAPVVVLDPRYGSGVLDAVSEPEPGRLLATFHSPAGDLNASVHGLFFAVLLPTRTDVPVDTAALVTLGPATAIAGAAGEPLALDPGDSDTIDFVPADLVFDGRFEDGDLFDWM